MKTAITIDLISKLEGIIETLYQQMPQTQDDEEICIPAWVKAYAGIAKEESLCIVVEEESGRIVLEPSEWDAVHIK